MKRIQYTDNAGRYQYDIVRFYDGEKSPLANVYKACNSKKLLSSEWNPDFERRYNSSWNKDAYAIMFSGGFDSLSLALRHLEKGERVYLLSIGFSKERTSSSLTVQFLKSIYGGEAVIGPIKLFSDILLNMESSNGLSQQPFTAFYASHMPDFVSNNIKAVECAYIMNDDALSYQNEIKAIYNNAMKCHSMGRKYPPMKFPLTKVPHSENLEFVSSVEQKYGIIFPALSAENISCEKFIDKANDELFVITGGGNQTKPNKECDVSGYLILRKNLFTIEKKKKYYEK